MRYLRAFFAPQPKQTPCVGAGDMRMKLFIVYVLLGLLFAGSIFDGLNETNWSSALKFVWVMLWPLSLVVNNWSWIQWLVLVMSIIGGGVWLIWFTPLGERFRAWRTRQVLVKQARGTPGRRRNTDRRTGERS